MDYKYTFLDLVNHIYERIIIMKKKNNKISYGLEKKIKTMEKGKEYYEEVEKNKDIKND